MKARVLSGVALALLMGVIPGFANPIFVANSSFENPVCGPTAPITCASTNNWVITALPGASVGSFLPLPTAWASLPDGLQAGFSNGGTLSQNVGVNIAPDTTYTLSVWVSQRWSAGSFLPDIQLLGGSTILFAMSNANPGGLAPTQGAESIMYNWVDWSMSWHSPTSGAIIGQVLTISLGSFATQTDFDVVRLDETVDSPEPGMFILVAGGLIGLGIRRRVVK